MVKVSVVLGFFILLTLLVYYVNVVVLISQAWKYKDRTAFSGRRELWLSFIPFYRVWRAIKWIHDSHDL